MAVTVPAVTPSRLSGEAVIDLLGEVPEIIF